MDEEDELRLKQLQETLQNSPIEAVSPPQTQLGGAHGGKRRVDLVDGPSCFAKPDGGCSDWDQAAPCEAAAWVVARTMGLRHLVAVTVYREIPLPEGGTIWAALQAWQDNVDADRLAAFPERETQWAAVFDYVIQQTPPCQPPVRQVELPIH